MTVSIRGCVADAELGQVLDVVVAGSERSGFSGKGVPCGDALRFQVALSLLSLPLPPAPPHHHPANSQIFLTNPAPCHLQPASTLESRTTPLLHRGAC